MAPFLLIWFSATAAADDRDLVFLADTQPIVIRLQVFVDGQPLDQQYEAAGEHSLKQLFRWLDRNGDGVLDSQEARNAPPPRLSGNNGSYPVNVAFNFAAMDTDGDGKLSLAEFRAYCRAFDGGPWQLRSLLSAASYGTSVVGTELFRRADRNKDGKLDAAELAGLEKLLEELDLNHDELLDLTDLRGSDPRTPLRGSIWQLCTTEETTKLLRRYSQPPWRFVLTARFGDRQPSEKMFDLVSADQPGQDVKITAATEEEIILSFKNTRLALRLVPETPAALREAARQDWLHRFEELDGGGKGFLTLAQAQADREFGQLFGLMDRNGDGQVQRQELLDWFREVQEPFLTQQFLRTVLHTTVEGRGLFDLLDTNSDGRLSRQELRRAPAVLAGCDRNGDGKIELSEIPRSFTVVFYPGQPEGLRTVDTYPGLPQANQLSAPLWFRRMDRNRDGVLSPQEFLGSADQFRQLDTDGDGLISRAEALRAASPPK